MQKKFIKTFATFGSLFALQILDPSAATYGMDASIDKEMTQLRRKGVTFNKFNQCVHRTGPGNGTGSACGDCKDTVQRIKVLEGQKNALVKQQQTEADLRAELLRAQIAALKSGNSK